jgi:hypothetical protein
MLKVMFLKNLASVSGVSLRNDSMIRCLLHHVSWYLYVQERDSDRRALRWLFAKLLSILFIEKMYL